jgi:hypothetical protein
MVAAAVVGAAVVGGVASNMAAGKQASAANNAADMQQQASQQMRSDLQPYAQTGQNAINPLWSAMGYNMDANGNASVNPNSMLQQQFQFNPNDLANTPGYQFARQQGLQSVQNQMSSQGLGLSGAQIKGAESFATGLADQTYGNQYNRALSTYNTNYQTAANNVNRLQNMVNMGQNSAAQQGQAGLSGAAGAGNYLTQAGNAQASGIMGVSNAANSGMNNYMTYNALYGNQPASSSGFGTQSGNFITS